jgi:hypothetical protein
MSTWSARKPAVKHVFRTEIRARTQLAHERETGAVAVNPFRGMADPLGGLLDSEIGIVACGGLRMRQSLIVPGFSQSGGNRGEHRRGVGGIETGNRGDEISDGQTTTPLALYYLPCVADTVALAAFELVFVAVRHKRAVAMVFTPPAQSLRVYLVRAAFHVCHFEQCRP